MSECPEKLKTKRQRGHRDSKPTGFISASLFTPAARDLKIRVPKEEASCKAVSSTPRPVMEMFEPFIHLGSLSLSSALSAQSQLSYFKTLELQTVISGYLTLF